MHSTAQLRSAGFARPLWCLIVIYYFHYFSSFTGSVGLAAVLHAAPHEENRGSYSKQRILVISSPPRTNDPTIRPTLFHYFQAKDRPRPPRPTAVYLSRSGRHGNSISIQNPSLRRIRKRIPNPICVVIRLFLLTKIGNHISIASKFCVD